MENKNSNNIFSFSFSVLSFVLDCLFPKFCVGCGQEGQWICQKCYQEIIFIKNPTCPKCNHLTERGQFCSQHKKNTQLTGLITCAYYENGPLKEAIHTYKYEGVFDIASDLSDILIKTLKHFSLNKNYLVIPVPLHRKKKAARGYNQSELMAKNVAKHYQLELINQKLIRTKYSVRAQMELSQKQREQNVVDCFGWLGSQYELRGKKIILIDDVYTTGATLNECAKVLRHDAGAKEIWGLTLAKV